MGKASQGTVADVYYEPCNYGIHVCGSDPVHDAAMTVLNIPARDAGHARAMFAAARYECEAQGDEPHDYVVDLNEGPENLHTEDFWICRQMLARLLPASEGEAVAVPHVNTTKNEME